MMDNQSDLVGEVESRVQEEVTQNQQLEAEKNQLPDDSNSNVASSMSFPLKCFKPC